MDPLLVSFYLSFLFSCRLSSSSGGIVTSRGADLFWNQKFSLTVNRVRGRRHKWSHLGFEHLLRYAKSCLIIAGQCFSQGPSGLMLVCVCVRELVWFLAVYHTDTQRCLFSSFFSLQRLLAVCMWPFQGFSPCLLIKALVRRRPAGPGLASPMLTIISLCLILHSFSFPAFWLVFITCFTGNSQDCLFVFRW